MKISIPKYSLKSGILIQITFVICLAFVVIVGYNSYANREVVSQNVKGFIKRQSETIISRIVNYVVTPKEIADNGASFLLSLDEKEKSKVMKDYALRTLKVVDGISSIRISMANQATFRVFEVEEDVYRKLYQDDKLPPHVRFILEVISYKKSQNTAYSILFSQQLKELAVTHTLLKNIETHPSFKEHLKSLENRKAQWSDIYIQPENNLLAITYSVPIINQNNILEGGFSVDISLSDLAFFLNEMRISDKTRLFIINQKNQIVADSDMGAQREILSADKTENKILATALSLKNSTDWKRPTQEVQAFQVDGKEFLTLTMPFPSSFNLDWKIVSIVPLKDFTEAFEDIQQNNFLISGVAILLILVFLYFLAENFSRPIIDLGVEVEKIKNLELEDPVALKSNVNEIEHLSSVIQNLKVSVANFSKYIPKKLVQKFIDNGEVVTIGGHSAEITILFTDIADFTTISETIPPQDLALHLSEYFEEMTNILHLNHATIDKFIGDAIMAFWGAPDLDENKNTRACRTALMCQQKLLKLNKYWELQGKPELKTRIGIHTGTTMVGNVGSSERMNYTALGDNVNTAARLEGVNKMYGTCVIISEEVLSKLGPEFITRPIDVVAVKGKKQGIRIFELIGIENDTYVPPVSEHHKLFARLFTQAFDMFLSKQWKDAKSAFESLEQQNKTTFNIPDNLVEMYIKRCKDFIKSPPPENWDGTAHLTEK